MNNANNNKMKTSKLFKGTYLVKGSHVAMEINNDSGKYWEIDQYSENSEGFNLIDFEFVQYETKKCAVNAIRAYENEAASKK